MILYITYIILHKYVGMIYERWKWGAAAAAVCNRPRMNLRLINNLVSGELNLYDDDLFVVIICVTRAPAQQRHAAIFGRGPNAGRD